MTHDVPKEIAVCPECGGPIKWHNLSGDVLCFCNASHIHAPEQSSPMLLKWNAVEEKVAQWLKIHGVTS